MWLDKIMFKILNEAEQEFKELDRETIKDIYISYWNNIPLFMSGLTFPRISVPKFGYLDPNLLYMKNKKIKYERECEGEKLKEIMDSIDRVKNERKKRKRG